MNVIIGILFLVCWNYNQIKNTEYQEFVSASVVDSLPPRTGVVVIKELGMPNKKNEKKKVEKSNTAYRENRSEKIGDITKTKAWKEAEKEKERGVQNTKSKEENSIVATPKNSEGLTLEEELRILAKTEDKNIPNLVHPYELKNCEFAFNSVDEFTGVKKRGLHARPFFNYTPDEYRKFIPEGDFITCDGFLSQSSDGSMALNINLYIASSEAKHKFGGIKPNSAMSLRTMDGKEFSLMTYQGAEAQISDNTTYYQCSFAINKTDLKQLQKSEIDQAKISFQKGFQVYDVFYLDFIIDQFPCFD